MIDYSLYFVLDLTTCEGKVDPILLAKMAIEGGVTVIQLRADGYHKKVIYETAIKLQKICKEQGIPLIINNECDIAIAVNATGVHVGQKDLPVEVVKQLLDNDKIIGLSISNQAELDELLNRSQQFQSQYQQHLVDYIGVGPVFSTISKVDAAPFLSVDGLAKLYRSTSFKQLKLPTVLIGGINDTNIMELKQFNPQGYAVISAISCAQFPNEAAQKLKRLISDQ